jgi:hypothetical protein
MFGFQPTARQRRSRLCKKALSGAQISFGEVWERFNMTRSSLFGDIENECRIIAKIYKGDVLSQFLGEEQNDSSNNGSAISDRLSKETSKLAELYGNDKQAYEAPSDSWDARQSDPSKNVKSAWLDDRSCGTTRSSENLISWKLMIALESIRTDINRRTSWMVDSICIDQEDKRETIGSFRS